MSLRSKLRLTATGMACIGWATPWSSTAGAQTTFVDVTGEAFVGRPVWPRGVAFGDCDNDGCPDALATPTGAMSAARVGLYTRVNGHRFADHFGALPLPGGLVNWSTWPGGGPILGDYDNDGDLDALVPLGVFLGAFASQNLLLRNDRGVFRSVGAEAGLTDVLPTDNAIWLDYDRDGHLDLYTGNLVIDVLPQGTLNRLHRNRGDGTFADATAEAGLAVPIQAANGGSNGGMVAADLSGDGWPDLYVGAFGSPNRLFLNDGRGGFVDATTPAIGDAGEAYGVAVGDIDNDGDLDLFQAAGGAWTAGRNPLLRNAGDGRFEDVLEEAGLGALAAAHTLEADLADVDNDGDLDLLTGNPAALYLNRGDGTFAAVADPAGLQTGTRGGGLAMADYDRDGYLDVLLGGKLYRNEGCCSHWLQVELVGVRSNRSAIGARILATAGDLRQVREVLGGQGYSQDELAAHFGLGSRPTVERLEVRWPSGQVDVHEGIPADQRVRLIEGLPGYHAVGITEHQITAADSVVEGGSLVVEATVRPALFESGARIVRVEADLSGWAEPARIPLADQADGTLRLEPTRVRVGGGRGIRDVRLFVEQSTVAGPWWTEVAKRVVVAPAADLVIFGDELAPGWSDSVGGTAASVDLQEQNTRDSGGAAMRLQGNGLIILELRAPAPLEMVGYQSLRFRFHPGDAALKRGGMFEARLVSYTITDAIAGTVTDQYLGARILGRDAVADPPPDMGVRDWQDVEVPLTSFRNPNFVSVGPALLEVLRLQAQFVGTVYLDDIRLVSAAASLPATTAVLEAQAATVPEDCVLAPNYPNPFNSSTVIRFGLPSRGTVDLTVYNLAGQQVAALVRGERDAGRYSATWNGRDAGGRPVATGVYICQLRAGERAQSRRVLLLR
ncbi:MAG: FG-GAP-like repeat-containing protein [Candidatus Latescibacterota bacterium]